MNDKLKTPLYRKPLRWLLHSIAGKDKGDTALAVLDILPEGKLIAVLNLLDGVKTKNWQKILAALIELGVKVPANI